MMRRDGGLERLPLWKSSHMQRLFYSSSNRSRGGVNDTNYMYLLATGVGGWTSVTVGYSKTSLMLIGGIHPGLLPRDSRRTASGNSSWNITVQSRREKKNRELNKPP